MKEIVVISLYESESYSSDITEILFITKNIKQALSIKLLFTQIQKLISNDRNIEHIKQLHFDSFMLSNNDKKVKVLHLEESDWNFSYCSENIILDIDDANKEMDRFIKEHDANTSNAYIYDFDISNSLTFNDINELARHAFNFSKNDLDIVKKVIKDIKTGEYFKPENKFRYRQLKLNH